MPVPFHLLDDVAVAGARLTENGVRLQERLETTNRTKIRRHVLVLRDAIELRSLAQLPYSAARAEISVIMNPKPSKY